MGPWTLLEMCGWSDHRDYDEISGVGWWSGSWREQNSVSGVSLTGQKISQLLVGWWAVYWSNGVPPTLGTVPSHLADGEMRVEEARDVPWGLGSAD